MKIKVKVNTAGCIPVRTSGKKSDCFDLKLAEDITIKKGNLVLADLGVSMKLPEGMVGKLLIRSSSSTKLGVTLANNLGFIDNSYSGNKDVWRAQLLALKDVSIPKGTRICQFEISLSQFATVWQKLRWLFTSKVELEVVDDLGEVNRGGHGSTGVK